MSNNKNWGVFFGIFVSIIFLLSTNGLVAKEPVKIIYDTDIGNDIDDTLALAMLLNFQNRGEIELAAITITKDNKYAAPFVKLINTFFGCPDIPIGVVKGSGVEPNDGMYLRQTLELTDESGNFAYPEHKQLIETEYPDATVLLRQVLANSEDHSVAIAQVGFSTNLARLLDTPADNISPLSGKELAQQKVSQVLAIAGTYSEELKDLPEYNVALDIPSAQKFFSEWPGTILVGGFELAHDILMTSQSIGEDYSYVPHHPIKEAYWAYRNGRNENRSTWDLTTILYAARPNRDYFGFSDLGTIQVQDNGTTRFVPKPDGNTRLMTVTPEQKARIQEAFHWICSEKQVMKPAQ